MVKIPNQVRRQIKAYIEKVKKEWPISAVFLFGSYGKGKAKKDSDIDLAIVSSKFKQEPTFETLERLQAFKWGIAPDIEPLAFNEQAFRRASPLDFAGGVVKKEGILIYQKNKYLL